MTDPTTGGVFASFAVVGDVNLAEPNALIRFAGDRVSAGTIGEELPPGYQRAEFWYSHGFVDRIVARPHLRDEIITLLDFLVAPGTQSATDVSAAQPSWTRSIFSVLTGARSSENDGETRNSDGELPRGDTNHG
jgi:acetyl-CoA carboxylase carboxyl transferase subunit beta